MTKPVIFISYSDKDEKEKDQLLSHLDVLQHQGVIDLWSNDRIGAGADWQQAMNEAIAQAKVAILLISTHFLTSDFILGEVIPTLLQRHNCEGLTIFPVIAKACAWQEVSWLTGMSVRPKNRKPIWGGGSRRVNEDLTAIAQEVAAMVKTGPPVTPERPSMLPPGRLGVPYQAPQLPTNFVPRPEYSDPLKRDLLHRTETSPGVLVVSAVHGMGGIGKSVLAAHLAYDPDVRRHFTDGILWATLGQKPDLLSILNRWIQDLGDHNYQPSTVEAATYHLRNLLVDKTVLLIVDDAWQEPEALACLAGGPRCRAMITTRIGLIARAVGAKPYLLDVLKPDQALELVVRSLRRELSGAEKKEVLALAQVVGYLPLALEQAATLISMDGLSWSQVLRELKQKLTRLIALEMPGADEALTEETRKKLSLKATFQLSLSRLPEARRQAFAWLGVLPEDVNLTAEMTTTLWATDLRSAQETLRYLQDRSLLLPGIPQADGRATYRQHDLLHDLAIELLQAPLHPTRPDFLPGLGLDLAVAHAALLKRYQAKTTHGLWHTLEPDGYIHARLTWHMAQAGQLDQIDTLLREETPEGRNGWYQTREQLAQIAGYLEDIARARSHTEQRINQKAQPQEGELALGRLLHYTLILTSLNSLAVNLPLNLLRLMVEKKLWSPALGLAYIRRMPTSFMQLVRPNSWKSFKSSDALVSLTPYLSEPLLQQALATAQAIEDAEYRAEALTNLAPHLPEGQQADTLQQALAAAQAIKEEGSRAYALTGLAPHLPEGQQADTLQQALAAAQAIEDERSRAQALTGLAPHLPEGQQADILQQALAAAQAIEDEWGRAYALIGLAPHLPEGQQADTLQQALAAAQAIKKEWGRAYALTGLAPHLSEGQQADTLQQALAAAQAIEDERSRAYALTGLAPHLPEGQQADTLRQALAAAQVIKEQWRRANVLTELAPHLPEPLLQQALAAAQAIKIEHYQARSVTSLALRFPKSIPLKNIISFITLALFDPVVDVTVSQKDYWQHNVLPNWIPWLVELPVLERSRYLVTLLNVVSKRSRSEALEVLTILAPFIASCGDNLIAETAKSIEDVSRWWP